MNEIVFIFITCAMLGGNFLEQKQELKHEKADTFQTECTRIAMTGNQYSCLSKIEKGTFLESSSNKTAEIYTFVENGKYRALVSKTGSQIYSWQEGKAIYQFSSMQDWFTGAKVCVGSAKEKK
jgi:hypothetical protein